MSLRLQMLQVARLAPKILGDSAALVASFLHRQFSPDGGCKDRTGRSDLYYTVFGLEGLLALRAEFPPKQTRRYLLAFGDGAGLDFVHLCCLARCWGALSGPHDCAMPAELRAGLLRRLQAHRSGDGGFHPVAAQSSGTVYAAFLGTGAFQDLQHPLDQAERLVASLQTLANADGSWPNERAVPGGSTNATAAAAALLRNLGARISARTADWLWARLHPQGGFVAAPTAPIPDLLSTATSLHALACLERDLSPLREACLDFIDTLWTNEGSFHGHWAEDILDSEYTYYGLLALGHLTV